MKDIAIYAGTATALLLGLAMGYPPQRVAIGCLMGLPAALMLSRLSDYNNTWWAWVAAVGIVGVLIFLSTMTSAQT